MIYTWECKDQTSSKFLIKIVKIRIIELNDAVVNYLTTLSKKKIGTFEHGFVQWRYGAEGDSNT